MKTKKATIKYVDNEKIPISFPAMVMNVKNINNRSGSLSEFAFEYELSGITNESIFIKEFKN